MVLLEALCTGLRILPPTPVVEGSSAYWENSNDRVLSPDEMPGSRLFPEHGGFRLNSRFASYGDLAAGTPRLRPPLLWNEM